MNEQLTTPPEHMPLDNPAPNPFNGPTAPMTAAEVERVKRETPEQALAEMVKHLGLGLMAALMLAGLAAAAQHPMRPDAKLTPGATDPRVTQATIKTTVCVPHYTEGVRSVGEAEKKQVAARYGLAAGELAKVEIDHYISLENGGSNEVTNLWPQYYATGRQVELGTYYGAREKDVVETYLHRQLCAGKITLREDQDMLRDWLSVYKKLKGIK